MYFLIPKILIWKNGIKFDVQTFIGHCQRCMVHCKMFHCLNYILLSIAIERLEIPLWDPSDIINERRAVRAISSVQPLWNPELELVD